MDKSDFGVEEELRGFEKKAFIPGVTQMPPLEFKIHAERILSDNQETLVQLKTSFDQGVFNDTAMIKMFYQVSELVRMSHYAKFCDWDLVCQEWQKMTFKLLQGQLLLIVEVLEYLEHCIHQLQQSVAIADPELFGKVLNIGDLLVRFALVQELASPSLKKQKEKFLVSVLSRINIPFELMTELSPVDLRSFLTPISQGDNIYRVCLNLPLETSMGAMEPIRQQLRKTGKVIVELPDYEQDDDDGFKFDVFWANKLDPQQAVEILQGYLFKPKEVVLINR